MPRPTAAQFAYGSATVVITTVALLLLTGTEALAGVAAVCLAGLALGLLVAAAVPATGRTGPERPAGGPRTGATRATVAAPRPRRAERTDERVGGHSSRR
ncbi:hypothetical protein [uncultured Streptomyces sp.]|uniref:hypothetical protein n=1 Tax=uncultured Streptomyces sp. TaxID=174707 RepID=UPI00260546BE|nr:hypothetical protein [uncultured Streptomyces sp.]